MGRQALADALAHRKRTLSPGIGKNECELITSNQKGREIYYELKVDKMKEIDTWLAQFRKIWEARYSQLDNLLSTLKKKEK